MIHELKMRDAPADAGSPELWRGLEELVESAEFREQAEREFPEGASEWHDPVSRRQFMAMLGASMALAGATGCSPRPASPRKIYPYVTQPPEVTPGIPLYFATSFPLGGVACGVLVRSQEGRPIKIEGNPSHPGSLGSTDVYTQASILGLYDPDRSAAITRDGEPGALEDAIAAVRQRFGKGQGVVVLSERTTSPTLLSLMSDFIRMGGRWVQYEPIGSENLTKGTAAAFGRALNVVYDISKADVILSLDADFLACGPGSVAYQHQFADRRRVRANHQHDDKLPESWPKEVSASEMNRLYVVEPMLTSTGATADHRLPLKAGEVEAFARAVAEELKVPGAPSSVQLPGNIRPWAAAVARDLDRVRKERDKHKEEKKKGDEHEHHGGGYSLVIAGQGQPASVHALAHAVNVALGNVGHTVRFTEPLDYWAPADRQGLPPITEVSGVEALQSLVTDMSAGKVRMLIILGGNPVFNAPADVDFAGALAKVPFKVHLGLYQDETAVLCNWHIPETHYLEAWGDARAYDGSAGIQQPLIAPLYGGHSALEFLGAMMDRPEQSAQELVRSYWRKVWDAEKSTEAFETRWQNSLRLGIITGSAPAFQEVTLAKEWAAGAAEGSAGSSGLTPIELNFRQDPTLYDGRFANNGWLQELPKPVTKICWDNAAMMSPKTAKDLGINITPRWTAGERGRMQTDIVELTVGSRKVRAMAWVLPGHADNCVTVHLGHGRKRAGRVGNESGFDGFTLRTSSHLWVVADAAVSKTGDTNFLACTQAFYSMEGRRPIRRSTAQTYLNDPNLRVTPAAPGESDLINDNVPGPDERAEHKPGRDKFTYKGTGNQEPTQWGTESAAPPVPGSHHEHKEGEKNGKSEGSTGKEEEQGHDRRLLPLTLYPDNNKINHRWGMVVDLSTCTGCSACIVACQAENNIPVVGKKEVTRGHEMQWLRIDRYFTVAGPEEGDLAIRDRAEKDTGEDQQTVSDPAAVRAYVQPVACVQCEKAPCELVCPVNATAHSYDGLNDMIYNRCVGTRYCSNNCPYKVRRFNFYTFADFATESLKLMHNPEVTLRSRGVMEKCTYCVQRIRAAEIEAEREWDKRPVDEHTGRPKIYDGEIQTACQAACPSQAIVFGDIADHDSLVRRLKTEPTNYGLLADLNTMPRTTYLAALRNPNPDPDLKPKKG